MKKTIFQEMKLFNIKLKNSYFLGKTFRVFHHCFFGCFLFFMLLFFHVFTWLFLHCCCCCYRKCYGFVLYSPFLLLARLPWSQQFNLESCSTSHWVSKHRPCSSVCLNHTVLRNYMISMELYLNLSKYVHKLLVVKSFINFKRIIIYN